MKAAVAFLVFELQTLKEQIKLFSYTDNFNCADNVSLTHVFDNNKLKN